MPKAATADDMECETCGTTYSSANPAAVAAHAGHVTEHIEQG